MSEQPPQEHDQPARPSRRRWLGYSLAGLVGGVIGAGAGGGLAHAASGGGRFGGFRRAHWHGGRGGFDPAKARAFAKDRLDYMLFKLDATPEQRHQVEGIADAAMDDLRTLREGRGEERRLVLEELAKPNVDRAALETMRAKHVADAEQASRRIVQALADAAEVLTPEQRARLPELLAHFGHRRG